MLLFHIVGAVVEGVAGGPEEAAPPAHGDDAAAAVVVSAPEEGEDLGRGRTGPGSSSVASFEGYSTMPHSARAFAEPCRRRTSRKADSSPNRLFETTLKQSESFTGPSQ